ncbi:MAG: putative maltokinase [Terriglobia bacterium]
MIDKPEPPMRAESFLDLSALGPALTAGLAEYLSRQRWYGGKADTLAALEIATRIPLADSGAFLFLVRVRYASGRAEQYALPLQPAADDAGDEVGPPDPLIVEPQGPASRMAFSDALEDARFAQFLLECIRDGVTISSGGAQLVARSTEALPRLVDFSQGPLPPSVMRVEQSNTSIKFGNKLMLKFFRRVEEGVNLDVETGLFLTEQAHFAHIPAVAGWIEIRREGRPPIALAVLQGFVENQGDAWKYTLHALDEYLGRTARMAAPGAGDERPPKPLFSGASFETPLRATELIGPYLASAALLGRRTAELHKALASDASDPRFAPDAFSSDDRKSACDSMEELAAHAFRLLQERLGFLEAVAQEKGRQVLSLRAEVVSRFRQLLTLPVTVQRTRLHGDYHLGQVLSTGTDFVIIDFEGEPERPLAARRAKRSPLRDVAGMLRSFHYAASTALERRNSARGAPAVESSSQELWAQYWRQWVSAEFLRAYLATAAGAPFVPHGDKELCALLDVFVLEKAVYEVIYELKNRPAWVAIPLDGILELL